MFVLLTVAIAPALALLSYFYLRKQVAPGPSRSLFYAFIYGVALTFPILFMQHVFEIEGVFTNDWMREVVFTSVIEEFFKWFILFIAIYRHAEFSDPYDGILYGASISLGFATMENILYLLTFGVETAIIRAVLPVASHALFGVVMGYYFGRARFTQQKKKKRTFALLALLIPLLLHGLYNSIFLIRDFWSYVIGPFMLFLWWYGLTKAKNAHNVSLKTYRE